MSDRITSRRRARFILGIALTSLIVGSFVWAPPASAATITVTTFEDELDESAPCSLREASIAASTDQAFGGCPAGSGPDIIQLAEGVYQLSIVGECPPPPPPPREGEAAAFQPACPDENLSENGDIDFWHGDVEQDDGYDPGITVQGVGMNATIIDGNGFVVQERVFDVRDGNATFADLTVRHGNGLTYGQRGGGIFGHSFEDTLTVLRSSVHANDAACRGGGVGAGGGMLLEIIDSEISNNAVPQTECSEGEDPVTSVADGGGVYAQVEYDIQNSTISDNFAFQRGGGIYAPNGFAGSISNSTVSGNEVTGSDFEGGPPQGSGGGLFIAPEGFLERGLAEQQQAQVTITDTTVNDNFAANQGGGLFIPCCGIIDIFGSTFSNNEAFEGGGIYSASGSENSTFLDNSTVSSNLAASAGGGIFNANGDMFLNHVTVYRNVANGSETPAGGGIADVSNFTLHYMNSIIARNSPEDCFGTEDSDGYNFLGDDTCSIDAETDIFSETGNLDPGLAPLRDNGGPTKTHALLPHSEAIDNASSDEACLATDQRGQTRPFGEGCDIGAYEVGPPEEEEPPPSVGGEVIAKDALCRRQNPTILGTLGPDRLVGTSGPDIIQGLDARDVILGKGGDDIICGSLGNDLLKGQGGDDWTKGLRGDDTDRGGPGNDRCVRGPGEDNYFSCENIPKEKQGK